MLISGYSGINSSTLNLVPSTHYTSVGVPTEVQISQWPDGISELIKVEVPDNEALTGIDLTMQPELLPRTGEISWTTSTDWHQNGAMPESVDYNQTTGLSLMSINEHWDFQGGFPADWVASTPANTFPNVAWNSPTYPTAGQGDTYIDHTTLSCGSNGTVAGAMKLQSDTSGGIGSSTGGHTLDAPRIDLSGASSVEVHYWVRKGWSACGEEPDTNENLEVKYLDSNLQWQVLDTFLGSVSGQQPAFQVSHVLPSNAYHSDFVLRFHHVYGTSNQFDWWFVDDVIITKPGNMGNWTSPEFGPDTIGNFQSVPGPYGLVSIDSSIPTGSTLNWSVLDANTMNPISGYENLNSIWANLGPIDWEEHPKLRLRLEMVKGGSSQGAMTIHGVHVQGRIVDSFDRSPVETGYFES